ncbi:hypothetical protein [Streptomyces sp. KR80]|uniref:hypothetical protein n=1 Tax=Streptomyces sp. KR80 TaxID=3457426 RepID=UPI003FD2581D
MTQRRSVGQRRYEKGAWELREGTRSRISEMRARIEATRDRATKDDDPGIRSAAPALAEQALVELGEAEQTLAHEDHPGRRVNKHLAAANVHLDVAYSLMLRMAPLADVEALMPGLVALVREHLPVTDERRKRVEEIGLAIRKERLTAAQREAVVGAVVTAQQALQREKLRVHSFVGIVLYVTIGLWLLAAAVAVLTSLSPDLVPLCFRPPSIGIVCPTGMEPDPKTANVAEEFAKVASAWDYLIVEIVGVVAAALASAATLRRIRGTSTPYNVPVVLAMLKLPTGALTAVLGLLLMRGEFVPGLTALNSSAQIIAWAIIFGYAQQIFTKFVDNQGQAVLNAIGGPHNPPAAVPGRAAQEAA